MGIPAPVVSCLAFDIAESPHRLGVNYWRGWLLLSRLVACCGGNPVVARIVHTTLVMLLYIGKVVSTRTDTAEATYTRCNVLLARPTTYVAVHSYLLGNGAYSPTPDAGQS